jgi:hypothetical protein
MPGNSTADLPVDLARRRLHVTTKLAGSLVDELEQLERDLRAGAPDRARLRGQVDDLAMLATVVLDELVALEPAT